MRIGIGQRCHRTRRVQRAALRHHHRRLEQLGQPQMPTTSTKIMIARAAAATPRTTTKSKSGGDESKIGLGRWSSTQTQTIHKLNDFSIRRFEIFGGLFYFLFLFGRIAKMHEYPRIEKWFMRECALCWSHCHQTQSGSERADRIRYVLE